MSAAFSKAIPLSASPAAVHDICEAQSCPDLPTICRKAFLTGREILVQPLSGLMGRI